MTPSSPVVLVVDDEPANLSTFARVFRRSFQIRTATSFVAALQELERGDVQVLITDYSMPTGAGTQLLAQVRERWPNVIRLLLSGHVDLPELQNARASGLAADVLPKPWEKQELEDKIRELLVHG